MPILLYNTGNPLLVLYDFKGIAFMNLIKYNRHWDKGFKYPYEKKRLEFEKLLESLNKRQIFELIGLRRTGKTTLLLQLINYLIDQGTPGHNIWYFTFDEEKKSIDELFQDFGLQAGLDFKKDKIYIFLDEIQKLPNFQSQLKIYYDLYPNLKFFISGSTSLFIKKKTQESLAGRLISEVLRPLNFREYLYFKNLSHLLENILMYNVELESQFAIFLESQFVETVFFETKQERRDYLISIMKKIIFEDITQIFSINNPEILWRIIKNIAARPGLLIDYNELSKEFEVSSKTISAYMYYLEEAFLIKKVYNFSKNLITSEKKLKKYYLASPSFSWALNNDFVDNIGKLVENYVISSKDYIFFWRDAYQHEVDFIDVVNDKIIPIEIKYKKEIILKEIKSLSIFANKFNVSKAVILSKNIEEKLLKFKDLDIVVKPVFLI